MFGRRDTEQKDVHGVMENHSSEGNYERMLEGCSNLEEVAQVVRKFHRAGHTGGEIKDFNGHLDVAKQRLGKNGQIKVEKKSGEGGFHWGRSGRQKAGGEVRHDYIEPDPNGPSFFKEVEARRGEHRSDLDEALNGKLEDEQPSSLSHRAWQYARK